MKTLRYYFAVIFTALCFSCFAADDEFYRNFLRVADTNSFPPPSVKSHLVVDTNNTAAKLTNAVIPLDKLRKRGEIADIRLGMTMDGVVARWGKPPYLHPHCDGGHLFRFSDCSLVFRGNALDKVRFRKTPTFDRGVSANSKLEDWMRILGPPTLRKDHAYGRSLAYETHEHLRTVLLLTFDLDGGMKFPPVLYLKPELTNWFKSTQE